MTAPPVAASIAAQCSSGTRRDGSFHWLTAALVTPRSVARAACEPVIAAAESIGCASMAQSIGFLTLGSQVFLSPLNSWPAYACGVTNEGIGDWIKSARAAKGWNQERLGEAVGVSKANVSHWETGKHEPSFNQLLRIRDVTGYALRDVGAAAEWPLPMIGREQITSLNAKQLEQVQLGLIGLLAAVAGSAELGKSTLQQGHAGPSRSKAA